MDLKDLIRERRTIQNFSKEKVSDDLVREAIELSLWAPNHRLTFPWHLILVEGAARLKLADLAVELKSKGGPLSPVATEAVRATILNPSHLLMLGLKPDEKPAVDKENYATLACSVQILSMALWEEGIGTKWSTAGFTQNPRTYEILNMSPKDVRFEGCLFIGKAAITPASAERPPLDAILHCVS